MNQIKENKEVFSLFAKATAKEPLFSLSMAEYASIVCDPSKGGEIFLEASKIVHEIRSIKDYEEQRRLKLLLPAVTPGALFGNDRQSVLNMTGLMQIDIDYGLNNAVEFRNIIGSYSWVVFSSLSVRHGVWFLVRIGDPTRQPEYWYKVNEWLKRNFGIEADKSKQKPTELRFFSPDPGAIFNPESRLLPSLPERECNINFKRKIIKRTRLNYISPLDDFNKNFEINPLLQQLGWKICSIKGRKMFYTRPGKENGKSAEWDEDKRRFFVFTSNSDLISVNNGRSLSAIDLYTQLKQISLAEAVREIQSQGWGSK